MRNEAPALSAADVVKTPIGKMWLVGLGDQLIGAELEPRWGDLAGWLDKRYGLSFAPGQIERRKTQVLLEAKGALARYFAGELRALAEIPVALDGSELQRRVWKAVRAVPVGRTLNYGQLATKAKLTGAFRAVGAANGANRCALFVPCHRIVASSGALCGYGAGLEVKGWLLRHEG